MNVCDRLLSFVNNNTVYDTNYNVALFVLQNFDAVIDMNINDLASTCHVSQSSISRFCKAIGYSSYIHFKEECISSQEIAIDQEELELSIQDSLLETQIITMYKRIQIDLEEFALSMNLKQIDSLLRKVHDYEDIILIGIGFSGFIAKYFQNKLTVNGKYIKVITDMFDLNSIERFGADTLVIVVSVNGLLFRTYPNLRDILTNSRCTKYLITQNTQLHLKNEFSETIFLGESNQSGNYKLQFVIDTLLKRYSNLYSKKTQL